MTTFNVHTATLPLNALTGAGPLALMRVAPEGGGITILEAMLYTSTTAGTSIGGKLVTFGTVGVPGTAGTVPTVNGTIGNFPGTIYTGAGTVHECPVGTAYVAAGYFIGFAQTAGTVAAGSNIQISYTLGK